MCWLTLCHTNSSLFSTTWLLVHFSLSLVLPFNVSLLLLPQPPWMEGQSTLYGPLKSLPPLRRINSPILFYAPLSTLLISIFREYNVSYSVTHCRQIGPSSYSSGGSVSLKLLSAVNFPHLSLPLDYGTRNGRAQGTFVDLNVLKWTLWVQDLPKEVSVLFKKTLEPEKIIIFIGSVNFPTVERLELLNSRNAQKEKIQLFFP